MSAHQPEQISIFPLQTCTHIPAASCIPSSSSSSTIYIYSWREKRKKHITKYGFPSFEFHLFAIAKSIRRTGIGKKKKGLYFCIENLFRAFTWPTNSVRLKLISKARQCRQANIYNYLPENAFLFAFVLYLWLLSC